MAEPIGQEDSAGRDPAGNAAGAAGSIEATLAERGGRYGDFTDHADLAQKLQDTMRGHVNSNALGYGWDRLSAVQKQALTVIADKIARILSGTPSYRDNWHDIAGYALLAEQRCED